LASANLSFTLGSINLDLKNLDFNCAYSVNEFELINNYLKIKPNFELVNKKLIPVSYSPVAIEAVVHEISRQLGNWNIKINKETGIVTTSKGGFDFNVTNNQKIRAPDVAYTPENTFLSLDENQLWSFKGQPFTPIFIVEVANLTNKVVAKDVDNKIKKDYFADGTSVKLGWLIDPINCNIWVYKRNRNGAPYRRHKKWEDLEAGDILPNFTLELGLINKIINKVYFS
jgi:Uma2 family endonuclease